MLKMYKKLWNEVKKQIKCNSVECSSAKSIEYEKDPMKIKFDELNIIVDKFYPQIYIHQCECKGWY